LNALRGRTDILQTAGIFAGLRQEEVDILQQLPQEKTKAVVSASCAVRDAGVDYCNGCAACFRQTEEVGPDFRFRDHDQLGMQQSQVGPNSKCEVQRKVKDIILAEARARQYLAGSSSSRNHHSMPRKF